MSDTTFRLARLGEDAAIIDFINANFDMRLPLLNRPVLYQHFYAGRGGVPQFAEAEQDGEGRQTMRVLARNMTFLMRSIALGREQFGLPEKEARIATHFIR